MTLDVLRIIAAVLAAYSTITAVALIPWWKARDPIDRAYLVALLEFVVAVGYGALEALLQGAPHGARIVLYTPGFALVAILNTWQIITKWRARRARKAEHED